VERRRFEHLFVELSVALGECVPRYALWLRIGELGWSPGALSQDAAVAFCRQDLPGFLAEHGLSLTPRRHRRLIRSVSRFDPQVRTPDEELNALFERMVGGS